MAENIQEQSVTEGGYSAVFLDSVNLYLNPLLFNQLDKQYTQKNISYPGKSSGEFLNGSAFAALLKDGAVVTWGVENNGGNSSVVSEELNGFIPVTQIYSSTAGFAALREDGSVVSWGRSEFGGIQSSSNSYSFPIKHIYSSAHAFAGLLENGSVVTWGDGRHGGNSDSVSSGLDGSIAVSQVFSTHSAFAALRENGTVITWGQSDYGGDSTNVTAEIDGSIPVEQIVSTGSAFAALRENGSVVTWGASTSGGASSVISSELNGTTRVKQIYSTSNAFAALREDGSVVTWGSSAFGGDSSSVASELNGSNPVRQIYSKTNGFAALREDGSVVTWGFQYWDNIRAIDIADELDGALPITHISATERAFAAIREDGSVVSWGQSGYGSDSSAVASQLNGSKPVVHIQSTGSSFAALRADGSVITWGDSNSGGDSTAVASKLDGTNPVINLYSTGNAFSALRLDGSVVTWGASDIGGDNEHVTDQLSDVVALSDPYTTIFYYTNTTDIVANNITTEASLTLGKLINSKIDAKDLDGSEYDTDYYRVELAVGQTYLFSAKAGLSGDLDQVFIRLRDSKGNQLVDDSYAEGATPSFTYTPETSGTYYLAISASSDDAESWKEKTGDYEISFEAIETETVDIPDIGWYEVFENHGGQYQGKVGTLANFSKAAYSLGDWETNTVDEFHNEYINDVSDAGRPVGSGRHADDVRDELFSSGDWVPLTLDLPEFSETAYLKQSVGLTFLDLTTRWVEEIPEGYRAGQTLTEKVKVPVPGVLVPREVEIDVDFVYGKIANKYEGGLYTFGSSAALLARNKDSVVIAFRGTNDNRGAKSKAGSYNDKDGNHYYRPDVGDWTDMPNHYQNFEPLITGLDKYIANNKDIKNVFVTGHSLGGAMAIAYMQDHGNTSQTEYEAITFAAPDYRYFDILNDEGFNATQNHRLTHIEINGDQVPALLGTDDPPGQRILYFVGDETQALVDFSNHSMDYYSEIAHSIDDLTWSDLLSRNEKTEILIGAKRESIPIERHGYPTEEFIVATSVDELTNDRRDIIYGGDSDDNLSSHLFNPNTEIFYGGAGNDHITALGGDDFLIGGLGNDFLDGGDTINPTNGGQLVDYDIARFDYLKSDLNFIVKLTINDWYRFHFNDGSADIITRIEGLSFLDGDLTFKEALSVFELKTDAQFKQEN